MIYGVCGISSSVTGRFGKAAKCYHGFPEGVRGASVLEASIVLVETMEKIGYGIAGG